MTDVSIWAKKSVQDTVETESTDEVFTDRPIWARGSEEQGGDGGKDGELTDGSIWAETSVQDSPEHR